VGLSSGKSAQGSESIHWLWPEQRQWHHGKAAWASAIELAGVDQNTIH